MYDILSGVQVLEVSQFAFVPAAGAILADWGADVIKVVHPEYGDIMHTATSSGLAPLPDGTAYMWEVVNRNKRSIGIDIAKDEGREVLYELARSSDVFVTNFLPTARQRLRIDVDDIRDANPNIIYARGSGYGPSGPDDDSPGYDAVSFWARTGYGHVLSQTVGTFITQLGPASGDLPSGLALAAGIAGALFRRERTGKCSIVDSSLMATGIWGLGGSITASKLYGLDSVPVRVREVPGNALFAGYETMDHRWLFLGGMVHEKGYADFAHRIGRPELLTDSRFEVESARHANHLEFTQLLAETFASRDLAEWCEVLHGGEVAFSPVQSQLELHSDPQVVANGYIQNAEKPSCPDLSLPASPIEFDEVPPSMRRAPEPGEDTEAILLQAGKTWDEISELKALGAVS
jgi:crotonobetainyl-CoA:carnitine CoA-transferase CaiB-like acyl-CoA transferase